ncbi:MAG TPA: hydrogenase maturation nickel metallochaperone HypA [Candidatus Hydrogenedens sp.]|nr:hydrogenase maturation nickel metallochaperone HypA [Candidatus Hydrogenedens sp.]HOK09117.1 hydrogenase maturation nickel metallochaperone HypA [Candidatus Hydrogenedens sp.]HOL20533.1 hydrogenase maturation nickel metallochaperone HypA [Candidatus Hydrogenedens sp.]HPP58825.1 hydrogenase maturation nickel metallochaperone HypA [Candidatus Hydrogenedens sp.]
MHELSIIESLIEQLEQIQKETGKGNIIRIDLRIGRLEHINQETFRFMFEQAKADTCAEHAHLNLIIDPLKIKCRSCHLEFEPDDGIWICPECGAIGGEILQGTEVILESVIFE